MSQRILAIIPARFASTRFPGKPLADIAGKSMIQRVYEQVKKNIAIDEIIVATDDDRISETVRDFGGKALMTAPYHQSGTDRCGEILQMMAGKFDIVINIQGDEPFIEPSQLDEVLSLFNNERVEIASLMKRITNKEQIFNPNVVKAVCSNKGKALYFSRNPIPYYRGIDENDWINYTTYYQHVGLYAFKASTLLQLIKISTSHLEKAESLEQLRWLENDFNIHLKETQHQNIGIDTPEDLIKALQNIQL